MIGQRELHTKIGWVAGGLQANNFKNVGKVAGYKDPYFMVMKLKGEVNNPSFIVRLAVSSDLSKEYYEGYADNRIFL